MNKIKWYALVLLGYKLLELNSIIRKHDLKEFVDFLSNIELLIDLIKILFEF